METKYISAPDTAKLVREVLKRNFPNVKFSVKTSQYSGGASISIHYTGGPSEERVERVVNRYEGASFDGMIDLKSYVSETQVNERGEMQEVHYGADSIYVTRGRTEEEKKRIIEECEKYAGVEKPFDMNRRYEIGSMHVYGRDLFWQTEKRLIKNGELCK